MARKPVDFINPDTGEVEQGYLFWGRARPKVRGNWVMSFQEAFIAVAQDRELKLEHHRILSYLLGKLDFDNFIHLKQADIAQALQINQSNVSKALAILRRKEIILIAPYRGVRCYKLNHWLGWKGSVVSFNREVKEAHERKLKLVKSDKQEQA